MRSFLIGFLFCIALFYEAIGQSPQGINYQGVARDSEGKPLVSKDISVRISILKDGATGDTEYAETHSVKTNSFGLFMLLIGQGKTSAGSFEFISWAIGNKWLQIELDPSGGNSFQLMGSQQLMSVPYAFYSTYSGNGLSGGQGIKIQNNQINNTGDADNNPTNETISEMAFGANKKLKITEAGVSKEVDLSSLAGAAQNLSEVLSIGNDAGGRKITNLAVPNSALDAATKQYVDSHTDADADALNEIQDLAITGNTLRLSGDASTIDLSSYLDNTDKQELTLTGNMLSLTNAGTFINLLPYLDNTDGQNLIATASGTNRSISISGGNAITIDVADDDNSVSNEIQTLTKAGTQISLSNGGGSISLIDDSATNEIQDLSLISNTLALSSDATTVNLTPYLDNTDNQDLTLSGNTLSLANDVTPVNLSSYLDNTDSQVLSTQSVDANTRSIAISGGNTLNVDVRDADASTSNEIQDLSLVSNTLALSSDASTVNLAPYLDNTDNQDLTLSGNTLSLANDVTPVNLSSYLDNTDSQVLSTQSVDANTRSIAISGGNTLNVDVRDADASITNEIQNLGNTVSGTQRTITISSGTGTTIDVADNDNDPANELQNLNQVLTRGKDAGGLQIQNLGTPSAVADATTKSYVDNSIATAIATNYAFKVSYSFINAGSTLTDSPISLTESIDYFNVVSSNKFTAVVSGTYLFTVSGNSLLGGIPVKLKITSGTVTLYDVKRQSAYPTASTINYMDSNVFKLNAGDTIELVVTSTMSGERVDGILFGYKL